MTFKELSAPGVRSFAVPTCTFGPLHPSVGRTLRAVAPATRHALLPRRTPPKRTFSKDSKRKTQRKRLKDSLLKDSLKDSKSSRDTQNGSKHQEKSRERPVARLKASAVL